MPSGGGTTRPARSWRSAATRISSPAMSRMRCLTRALRDLPGDAAEPVELTPAPRSRSATAPRYSRPARTACRRRHRARAGNHAARRRRRASPALVAADAVIGGRRDRPGERGRLGDELVELAPARRAARRSPRMSCSPTSAMRSGGTKPRSTPSVTSETAPAGLRRTAAQFPPRRRRGSRAPSGDAPAGRGSPRSRRR